MSAKSTGCDESGTSLEYMTFVGGVETVLEERISFEFYDESASWFAKRFINLCDLRFGNTTPLMQRRSPQGWILLRSYKAERVDDRRG